MKYLSLNLFLLVSLFLTSSCYNLDNELEDNKAKGNNSIINNGGTFDGSFKYDGSPINIFNATLSNLPSIPEIKTFNVSLIDNAVPPKNLNLTLSYPASKDISGTYSFDSNEKYIQDGFYNYTSINDILDSGTIEVTKISDTNYKIKINCVTESGKKVEADFTREFTIINL